MATSRRPSRASSISTRSTKSPKKTRTPPSPAMFPVKACNKRCSKSWRAPSPTCLPRVAANIRTRNLLPSIPPTFCLSAAAPLSAWKKSSRSAPAAARSVSTPMLLPPRRNTELLEQVQPGDLIRYGLIPEFVGRLPVAGVMNDLDKNALVRILTEPKNALLKQYQRLFEFENVRLRFTDDALETVAELALQRKVGARGLRMILEDLMLELMYHLPMQRKVRDFVVSADMVRTREINWSLLEKAG